MVKVIIRHARGRLDQLYQLLDSQGYRWRSDNSLLSKMNMDAEELYLYDDHTVCFNRSNEDIDRLIDDYPEAEIAECDDYIWHSKSPAEYVIEYGNLEELF